MDIIKSISSSFLVNSCFVQSCFRFVLVLFIIGLHCFNIVNRLHFKLHFRAALCCAYVVLAAILCFTSCIPPYILNFQYFDRNFHFHMAILLQHYFIVLHLQVLMQPLIFFWSLTPPCVSVSKPCPLQPLYFDHAFL